MYSSVPSMTGYEDSKSLYVTICKKRDHVEQKLDFVFAAHRVRVHSLHFLLQFVSLNYIAAFV